MITVVGTSAVASAASGDVLVTPPTTVSDDIMVLSMAQRDTVVSTLPAGWTISQQVNTGVFSMVMAWKKCVGAEAAFTVTHTAGAQIVARLTVYRGCMNTAGVVNVTGSITGGPVHIPVTTTVSGGMAVFTLVMNANTAGFSNYSMRGFSSPNLLMERFLTFGDNAGGGGNKTIVASADAIIPFAQSGTLGATKTGVVNPYLGYVVLTPAPEILTITAKVARSPGQVVLAN